jgi:hypothetical protein
MTEPHRDMETIEARLEAMRVLRAAGWDERRIALALGMRSSWELATKWMREAAE